MLIGTTDQRAVHKPQMSAVICTRNRGDTVVPTLKSILANTHPNFEVILIDQSTNQTTWSAIQRFCNDPRIQYIHSETKGLGLSRNLGLEHANSSLIAYLDDDVTVPSDWLEKLEKVFSSNEKIALIYCQVIPGPFAADKGYIPEFPISKDYALTKMSDLITHELGIGAGMAVNKRALDQIGGFDQFLGAGAIFRSAEDRDIAIRLLLKGWWVYFSAQTAAIHYGFRTFAEGIEHTKGDFIGLGAAYIKPLKCGYLNGITLLFAKPRMINWFEPLLKITHLKKPAGFKKFLYFWLGVFKGLMTPVDRRNILYRID